MQYFDNGMDCYPNPFTAGNDTPVQVSDVKILFNGTNITGKTTNVIVGQQINLSLQVLPAGATATNIQWTVPGNPIGNYAVTYTGTSAATSASVEAVSGLQDAQLSFYWVTGASSRQVTVTGKVDQVAFSKTATFSVKRPTAQVTATTPGSVVLTSAWPAGYGMFFGTPSAVGINFSRSITMPTGFSGDTQWVQLIQTLRRRQLNTGLWQKLESTDYVLDNSYPYSASLSTNDSPGTPLTSDYLQKTASDNFKMWLMFKPTGTGSIWVPLRVVTWSWSGAASRSGSVWTLGTNNHSGNPASADSTTYPTWSSNFTLLSWVNE